MQTKGASTPDEFILLYERALALQGWSAVAPLVHDDACVTFSNGTVRLGKTAVQRAFKANFAAIADEEYQISHIRWVHRGAEIAVYLFDIKWSGLAGGQAASGSGRGTSVLHRDDHGWKLLVEHLGPPSA